MLVVKSLLFPMPQTLRTRHVYRRPTTVIALDKQESRTGTLNIVLIRNAPLHVGSNSLALGLKNYEEMPSRHCLCLGRRYRLYLQVSSE